ncbi:MAG: cell wall hydrolase [Clostridiales bacterium]|nr:cell wall hydrolase [Clostridiales bacterium]
MTAKQKQNLRKMQKIRAVIAAILAAALIGTSLLVAAACNKVVAEGTDISEASTIEETSMTAESAPESPVIEAEEITEPQTSEEKEEQTEIAGCGWEAYESEILVRIAMAEAEGEGTYGKALVMKVVLNRVMSDEFPDSIEAVVFEEGQFSTVSDGGRYYTVEPDEECYEALGMVEAGWDETQGALYFESCNGDSWHSRNLDFLFQYGNHKFYTEEDA